MSERTPATCVRSGGSPIVAAYFLRPRLLAIVSRADESNCLRRSSTLIDGDDRESLEVSVASELFRLTFFKGPASSFLSRLSDGSLCCCQNPAEVRRWLLLLNGAGCGSAMTKLMSNTTFSTLLAMCGARLMRCSLFRPEYPHSPTCRWEKRCGSGSSDHARQDCLRVFKQRRFVASGRFASNSISSIIRSLIS